MAYTFDYIDTKENCCADLIYRVPTNINVYDFSTLIQEFPELRSYQRLHLSREFLSYTFADTVARACTKSGPDSAANKEKSRRDHFILFSIEHNITDPSMQSFSQ